MRRVFIVSIGLLLLAGCGPAGSDRGGLQGTITYKGQPVNGATLHLYPSSGGGDLLVPVSQDGKFNTTDLPPGDYKVVVQGVAGNSGMPSGAGLSPEMAAKLKAMAEKSQTTPTIPFPDKYKRAETTDLTCKITKGQQTLTLELKD